MQPLQLNASKVWQTFPVGSLKKSEIHLRINKSSLVTGVDGLKTSCIVKLRRWDNFIVKFQI